MDEAPPQKPAGEGAPAWVMTFADLMSLLMCFFVLLLAFSEMDVLKFKQLAGSMREAFGVQRDVKAKEIPKGTSIIAREFSPGKPEPTLVTDIRQHTTDELQQNLRVADEKRQDQNLIGEVSNGGDAEGGTPEPENAEPEPEPPPTVAQDDEVEPSDIAQAQAETADAAYTGGPPPVDPTELRESFAAEIAAGLIDVEADGQRIIIRIREKGSFPSGRADLMDHFMPVIERIAVVLERTQGRIVIAGHTDNIPISTARFRSNWELSAARSVTVVHHLAKTGYLAHDRFLVEGHADTAPLAPNDSSSNRALNRRVEVVIVRGELAEGREVSIEADAGPISDDAGTSEPVADAPGGREPRAGEPVADAPQPVDPETPA